MKKQSITILGSTGSIGKSTLDVLSRHPQRFEVYALAAHSQVELMAQQVAQFKPQRVVMADASAALRLKSVLKEKGLSALVESGEDAMESIASDAQTDIVMAAIVGAAGLAPSLAAARAGKRLLLANKEALVVGGSLFMSAVKAGAARLLPIDSEHS
jgi:1-deoxy-D-xylulose-5-phosphate reductoisomerase